MEIIFFIAILIFSVVIHEVSHGVVAYMLGDPTAKYQGRLTLNPIPHIDPFGSIILPLLLSIPVLFGATPIIFGWAKPVPYNPYNLKNQKWGPAIVGAAGPLSNVFVAIIFGQLIRFSDSLSFLPAPFFAIAGSIALINLFLAIFNLIPMPPLDGSKLLFALLPPRAYKVQEFLERYAFPMLFLFIVFFSGILFPIASFMFYLITGASF
jgi:Zn-dependent protease